MRVELLLLLFHFVLTSTLFLMAWHSMTPILDCKESHYIKCPAGKEKVVLLLTNSHLLFLPYCVAP